MSDNKKSGADKLVHIHSLLVIATKLISTSVDELLLSTEDSLRYQAIVLDMHESLPTLAIDFERVLSKYLENDHKNNVLCHIPFSIICKDLIAAGYAEVIVPRDVTVAQLKKYLPQIFINKSTTSCNLLKVGQSHTPTILRLYSDTIEEFDNETLHKFLVTDGNIIYVDIEIFPESRVDAITAIQQDNFSSWGRRLKGMELFLAGGKEISTDKSLILE